MRHAIGKAPHAAPRGGKSGSAARASSRGSMRTHFTRLLNGALVAVPLGLCLLPGAPPGAPTMDSSIARDTLPRVPPAAAPAVRAAAAEAVAAAPQVLQ